MNTPSTEADLPPEAPAAFDWRRVWYPLCFVEDMPTDRPLRVTLYDEGLVLFRDSGGTLNCLRDLCPHRAARLSDGRIIDDRIECPYHGWQFDGAGDCQLIPQMMPGKDYPIRSCVRRYPLEIVQGIAWVWPGEPAASDPALIPRTPALDGQDVHSVTFQMDVPYDQSYLIENVIDVAHINIAHDGVRSGGLRAAARPLQFRIAQSGPDGFSASFRSHGLVRGADTANIRDAHVAFVAPNLVRYTSEYVDRSLVAGLELYTLPMGKGRARLFYRKFSNFYGWQERILPRWREHLTQCLILEQDMAVVVGQQQEIERGGRSLRELWLPIKTSDRLVIEYRNWLDRNGAGLPYYRGFASAVNDSTARTDPHAPHDRHSLHTAICATCLRVVRWIDRCMMLATATAAFSVAAAILAPVDSVARWTGVGVAVAAICALLALRRFRTKF